MSSLNLTLSRSNLPVDKLTMNDEYGLQVFSCPNFQKKKKNSFSTRKHVKLLKAIQCFRLIIEFRIKFHGEGTRDGVFAED